MPNNIQTIIDKFDKEFGGEEKHLSDYYVNDVKQFLSQAIDQTREETIRECIKKINNTFSGLIAE